MRYLQIRIKIFKALQKQVYMDSSKHLYKKKQMKKHILKQLTLLKPKPGATTDQAIQSLVKQAQFYTNFLLSKHENKRAAARARQKRRGHFDQELSEERHLMQEQQEEQQNELTRLSQQPSILSGGRLKHYQLVGLNWMINLYESGLSGILADDMGLGKTIQTISMIAFLRQYKKVKGPHLVIAPKITLGNWKNQFQKWFPEANVVKLIATKEERTQILKNVVLPGNFDVIVTSFQGVRICLNYLTKIKWHYIVIDEAHKIKNQESKLSQLVRRLSNESKLLLTGTPLQNNLHELWSLLNFLLPQIFDSSEMFDIWFDQKDEEQQKKTQEQIQKKNVHMIQQLHKILRPFMLRRTKLEVQKTLPIKKQIHIFVGLTDTQLRVYKNILHKRNATQDQKKVYLNLLMQLRKVCNHPYLFEGVEEEGAPQLGQHIIQSSGKMIILDKLLKKLKSQGGHQVLIFSQMTMVMDILEDYCNFREYNYCRIDGSTDMNSRDQQIEQFMSPDSNKFIFLLSTRAGGLGINLTSADTVIIYDSDWNPQMDLQAMDRAHRIGQKNMVNVYRLITQDTIEQKIIERQQVKLKWDNLVIQQAKTSSQKNKALTKEQIKDMLQYGASITLKSDKGTIRDEDINQILERGQMKTNEMNKKLDQKVKDQQKSLTDFSMNSINIFDFMMNDEKKKQDMQALDQAMARKINEADNDMRTRRQKLKNANNQNEGKKQFFKSDKKQFLPEHHFYENKDLLIQLLQKQQQYHYYKHTQNPRQPLTQQQNLLKQQLFDTGFKNWNKTDFNAFITASQKSGRNNLTQIARSVGKDLDQVEQYHKVFWQRINELSQKDRILKQIQSGQDKIANKKYNTLLLDWKASQCYQIDFNPQIYTKFKSKLFSIDADRFLAQCAYKHGIKNMSYIKQKIRTQPMFRFDHHFRSRSQSQLNKRLQSLYKLIQKQKDHIQFGFDNEMFRQNKKKSKKTKKQRKTENIGDQADRNSAQEDESSKKKQNRKLLKQKQMLLSQFNRSNKPNQIEIEDSAEEE